MGYNHTVPGSGLAAHPFTGTLGWNVGNYTRNLANDLRGYQAQQAARPTGVQQLTQAPRNPMLGQPPAPGYTAITGGQRVNAPGAYAAQTLSDMQRYAGKRDPGIRTPYDLANAPDSALTPALDYAYRDAERRRQQRGLGMVPMLGSAVLGLAGVPMVPRGLFSGGQLAGG